MRIVSETSGTLSNTPTFELQGSQKENREGNGNPLQYSCLENPMDGGAWQDTVHWGHKESDTTERLHFHFQRSLRLSSVLFILFTLFYSSELISTILSSSSLICSSASDILLLISSRVFLISVIVLSLYVYSLILLGLC